MLKLQIENLWNLVSLQTSLEKPLSVNCKRIRFSIDILVLKEQILILFSRSPVQFEQRFQSADRTLWPTVPAHFAIHRICSDYQLPDEESFSALYKMNNFATSNTPIILKLGFATGIIE